MSEADLAAVRAVYFDLDDTLCPYWEASKCGLRRAFERHRPEGFSVEEMLHFWAVAFREFAPKLKQSEWYQRYLKDGSVTRVEQMRRALIHADCGDLSLAERLAEVYAEERNQALILFDDAREVLDALYGRFPLGLITNGPADVQRQEIATIGVEKYFKAVFVEGELGFGKPRPEVFHLAQAAVGFEPAEILFVGNSYGQDMRPAIAQGWRTAWVRRPTDAPPSSNIPETKPEGAPDPDCVISDLRELLTPLGLEAVNEP
jgi:putative hydrolase of the HAD superfamily